MTEELEKVSASHIGYLCRARKVAIVRHPQSSRFAVENMARNVSQSVAGREAFGAVYEGPVERVETALGVFGICDFSAVTAPGVYRITLPEGDALSYQFTIADGVYSRPALMMLDFIHELRSGFYASDLRGPTHLDDGVRSDTGEAWDAVGGWYDAGDTRKWMAHTLLPALAFFDMAERLRLDRTAFTEPGPYANDWLTEAAWGVPLIAKMQDPETGMIFEDVGGGGTARKRDGMSWWYENHAGCYADNADNRFTDNRRGTGDERTVRVQYNPIAQYTNVAIAARASAVYPGRDNRLAELAYQAAERGWHFANERLGDEYHRWTSVRAWRLGAALQRYCVGLEEAETVDAAVQALIATFEASTGFWRQSVDTDDPYRGILHSAQPLIALAMYLDYLPNGAAREQARHTLRICKQRYVQPLVRTNPYRFVPYGLYRDRATEGDTYRPFDGGLFYRFTMPTNHPQQINHGLSGHWMSWAHGLAYAGRVLEDERLTDLAWDQIHWLLGNNQVDVSFVSGLGFNNPMPHSRFLGTIPGGFCTAFRGTPEDIPYVDQQRYAEWNSTEYWNVPLSNFLMALSLLLPAEIPTRHKLGRSVEADD